MLFTFSVNLPKWACGIETAHAILLPVVGSIAVGHRGCAPIHTIQLCSVSNVLITILQHLSFLSILFEILKNLLSGYVGLSLCSRFASHIFSSCSLPESLLNPVRHQQRYVPAPLALCFYCLRPRIFPSQLDHLIQPLHRHHTNCVCTATA